MKMILEHLILAHHFPSLRSFLVVLSEKDSAKLISIKGSL